MADCAGAFGDEDMGRGCGIGEESKDLAGEADGRAVGVCGFQGFAFALFEGRAIRSCQWD